MPKESVTIYPYQYRYPSTITWSFTAAEICLDGAREPSWKSIKVNACGSISLNMAMEWLKREYPNIGGYGISPK
jgi:hypothetical protein